MRSETKSKSDLEETLVLAFMEKTFTHLIGFIPDINFFAKDRRGRFLFVNQNFAAKCGKPSPKEIIGLTDLDIWPKSLGEKYRRDDLEIFSDGKPRIDIVELITASGQGAEWYSTTKLPIKDNQGIVIGVAGFTRDMKMSPIKSAPINGIMAARDTILSDFGKPFDLQSLASQAFLSISQFDRRFKAAFRMSPRKYITMIRIQAACHALARTDEQISKIARDCGFYDLSHLNHQFKREMKITPRDYRKIHAENPDRRDPESFP